MDENPFYRIFYKIGKNKKLLIPYKKCDTIQQENIFAKKERG